MKEPESPRFLASGQWVDQEEPDNHGLLSAFSWRSDRKARMERSWDEVFALHDEIFRRWSEYELDLAKLIDYPMMTDMREPHTVAMVKAMRTAGRLRPTTAAGHHEEAARSEYGQAVREFEEAFLIAEGEAKRIKRGHFTREEQERLQSARQLLNVAGDEGSSPSERQGAYKQLRKAVDGLIAIPDRALAALEARSELRRHAHDVESNSAESGNAESQGDSWK